MIRPYNVLNLTQSNGITSRAHNVVQTAAVSRCHITGVGRGICSAYELKERTAAFFVLHATVSALDPEVLHTQMEQSVRALLQEGESANTFRSYVSALRCWAAWFRLRYRSAIALPVPTPAVLQFLVDHMDRTAEDGTLVHDLPPAIDAMLVQNGFKGALGAPALNTVLHRLSVLSKAHQLREAVNPARDPAVQELVRRIRRAYAARGPVTVRKTALTKDPLEAMLATGTDGLIGIRDRALLLIAFSSGGRRRSEVAAAVLEHVVKVDANTYLLSVNALQDRAGPDRAQRGRGQAPGRTGRSGPHGVARGLRGDLGRYFQAGPQDQSGRAALRASGGSS